MTHFDPKSDSSVVMAVNAKDYVNTVPANGASPAENVVVDLQGFRWCRLDFTFGALAGGTSLAVKVQESTSSGGTYADVTGATFQTATVATSTTINTVRSIVIDCAVRNRYLRLAYTKTGTMTAMPLACTATLVRAQDSTFLPSTSIVDATITS